MVSMAMCLIAESTLCIFVVWLKSTNGKKRCMVHHMNIGDGIVMNILIRSIIFRPIGINNPHE